MKAIQTFILLGVALVSLCGCQNDPLEEVNEGAWNNERNILGVEFNGQIGDAVITRVGDTATISFTYNTAMGEDLSKVALNELEISYGATASVATGTLLNFDNATHTDSIIVTSAQGKKLVWYVTLNPFTETLLGTWKITGQYVYGGTGPAYGGANVFEMSAITWAWSASTGPAAELDNTLTFTMGGVTEEGNSYGTIVNDPGPNGLFANYMFYSSVGNADVNGFYRKIPTGTGSWVRDYSAGTVTFTFADGTTTTGTFAAAGTETLYGSITKTIVDHAFVYTLTGKDDWTNIYKDYDKFVSNPRKFWVDIAKQ